MSITTPVTIVGNLTDDPELKFTPSGAAVARLSVAVNRRTYNRQTSQWEESGTDFHRVTAWRGLAENIAGSLAKGMRVIVVGDLRQRSWEDEKTKEKRSAWEVTASAIGPDLTFATATVAKSTKREAAPGDDAWATASRNRPADAGAASNGWEQAPATAGAGAGAAGGYSEEPPF